jgi:hypothetical protein
MKKPQLNDFFIRGVPLSIALDALEKWGTLTKEQREILGFMPAQTSLSPARLHLVQKQSE